MIINAHIYNNFSGTKEKGQGFNKTFSDIRRKSLEEYELKRQMDEYNFQPKINEYKGNKIEESKEDRWNRLLSNKIEKMKKNEQIKQELETREINENCTFQPEINQDFQMKNEQKINLLSLYNKYFQINYLNIFCD